jgi:hypothetical protein
MRRKAGVCSTLLAVGLVISTALATPGPAVAVTSPAGFTRPPSRVGPSIQSTSGVKYLYAAAGFYGPADGASAAATVNNPALRAGDFHTLFEIAVQSADARQIVEVGWTVDRVYGDGAPHLFVYHWVDGAPTCYDGCGFVTTSNTVRPGMRLPLSTKPVPFSIRREGSAWAVTYGGSSLTGPIRIGYFPDALWGGRFKKAGLIQVFGEVAAASTTSCTDMGNGLAAANPGAASAGSLRKITRGLGYDIETPASISWTVVSNRSLYDLVQPSSSSFRYGGPGAC